MGGVAALGFLGYKVFKKLKKIKPQQMPSADSVQPKEPAEELKAPTIEDVNPEVAQDVRKKARKQQGRASTILSSDTGSTAKTTLG